MLGASLGLISVFAFSVSNMVSGVVTRKRGSIVVAVFGRLIGALVVLPAMLVIPTQSVTRNDIVFSLAAGFFVAGSLLLFFRSVRGGSLGATCALKATLCAVLPVMVLLAVGVETLTPALAIGALVAVFSGVMITRASPSTGSTNTTKSKSVRRSYAFAAASGVCYGTAVILLGHTSDEAGLLPALLLQVAAGLAVAIVGLFRGTRLRLWGGDLGRIVAAGTCSSVGTVMLLVAAKLKVLSVVAVMQSLSSVIVAALAWLFLQEKLARLQKVAIAGSVVGTALLAAA